MVPYKALNNTHIPHTAHALVNKRQVATKTVHGTQRAHAPVNRRQVAQDTAHAHALRAAEGQGATNHTPRVRCTGATQPVRQASGRSGPPRTLIRARPGCIADNGKSHPEPWQQSITGVRAHSPGGGRLPSRGAPQLEPPG